MVDNSGLIGGGGIPEGDQLRVSAVTFGNNQTDTDVTILSESGGTGGVIYGVSVYNRDSGNLNVNSIKVTIDGASERTLDLDDAYNTIDGDLSANFRWLPVPVNYASSITVKLNYTTANTAFSPRTGVLFYSLKT